MRACHPLLARLAALPAGSSPPPALPALGTLLVVATPLGHLGDVSARALDVLQRAPLVAAEDTRVTRRLLHAHGADRGGARVVSCHDHNERDRVALVLARLAAGDDVALVADAGTPGISDPGHRVVAAARAAGFAVSPVPGPSSLVAALSVAGLQVAADHGGGGALFVGFLPHAPGTELARQRWLAQLAREHARRAVVLYEAPTRVAQTLRELAQWHDALHGGGGGGGQGGRGPDTGGRGDSGGGGGGDSGDCGGGGSGRAGCAAPRRRVLVAREMTKAYESITEYDSLWGAHAAFVAAAAAPAGRGGGGGGGGEDGAPRHDAAAAAATTTLGEFTLVLHPLDEELVGVAATMGEGATAGSSSPDGGGGGGGAPGQPADAALALADAVALARELRAQRGLRASEAVALAAELAGVRRKLLMRAVADDVLASRSS